MHPESGSIDLIGVVWRLGATLFFVALNGFFVAAEFSLVKVRSARIQELVGGGRPAAGTVKHILSHLDLYLSACQLGITLASLALGALGEPAVSVLIRAALEAFGFSVDAGARWLPIVSISLAFVVITILHMTLGEQAPKMLALRKPESTSLAAAGVLRVFTFLFRPFIMLINAISNWMLGVVGIPSGAHGDPVPSAEEIRSILSLSARAGEISAHEFTMTRNVFRLIDLEVRHIMVPRVDVESLSLEDPLEESLDVIRASSHSRFPLCEGGLDTIVGFIHGKDVLAKVLGGEAVDLRELARKPLIVPDTMALSDLFLEMQRTRVHLAAVADEHGTVVGLAFREDALEEIVGPLGDEFDEMIVDFRELDENTVLVGGRIPFPDLCSRLQIQVEDDEGEETVGGWLVAQLGRMAERGDVVGLGNWKATVEEVGHRRINRLRLERMPEDPGGTEGSEQP
jgi:CBS domain containing-hemolysin-like protein